MRLLRQPFRLPVVITSGAIAVASIAFLAPPAAAAPGYTEYVSLGDSYVAGANILPPPVTDQAPGGCFQRGDNYPRQLAAALGIPTHRDASCSGATLNHLTSSQDTGLGVNAPQYNRLSATTDLVTIGFGANDIGIGTEAINCLSLLSFPNPSCKTAVNRALGKIPAVEAQFVAALQEIHRRSPNAQIFAVSMLDIFPKTGCWPSIPINNTDMGLLNGAENALAAMVGRAAAAGGAHFVDITAMSGGHDICKRATVRWVDGIMPISINGGLAFHTPFHPNTAGTNAQASFLINAVGGVAPLAAATTTTTSTTATTTTTTTTTTTPATTTTPPATAPATTAPTTTQPPATQPPTTAPPTTVPPTTAPPVTEPPTTAPPVTEPPTTVAVTEPPATEPPTTTTA